jgi:hypothetical protein
MRNDADNFNRIVFVGFFRTFGFASVSLKTYIRPKLKRASGISTRSLRSALRVEMAGTMKKTIMSFTAPIEPKLEGVQNEKGLV